MELLKQIAEELPDWLNVRNMIVVVAALAALWVLRAVLSKKKSKRRGNRVLELEIDYHSLGDEGPPPGRLQLEFLSIPVRLAAVVLAPSGRMGDLPPEEVMPILFSSIVPGLDQVVGLHKPLVRHWPPQVSHSGFVQKFFAKVHLPGDFGAGTPWSAVAGEFKCRGVPMLAGLVLCAAASNYYGQKRIERPESWHECLRVIGQA